MRIQLPMLALLVNITACASAPDPGGAGYSYNVSGAYTGHFYVDGQPFVSALQLRTSPGGSVRGAFRVSLPVEIEGVASGEIVRDLLSVEISYTDERGCQSRIEGLLRIAVGGTSLSGPVTVHDCGAETAGRMAFTRARRRPFGR